MICEGTYDKATKTISLAGTMPMPDGSSMKVTQTTVSKDANTRVFTLKGLGPDGKDMDMIQVTYKRRMK
jgi:vacuolar-type H+-ATPase catalytic subunit A/Vma1